MKIKTSELIGSALDWAVAKCEGLMPGQIAIDGVQQGFYSPSTDWKQGGPIIEREGLGVLQRNNKPESPNRWTATKYVSGRCSENNLPLYVYATTPLIAAMRCYVASKLGDEIDVPEML